MSKHSVSVLLRRSTATIAIAGLVSGVVLAAAGPASAAASSTTAVSRTGGPNPSTYGQAITVQAVVTASATPTGSVTFTVNGAPACTSVPLHSTSSTTAAASCTLQPGAGSDSVGAAYSGDSGTLSSSGSLGITVNPAAVSVTASTATQTYGDAHSSTVTASYLGLQYGETGASLPTPPDCQSHAVPTTPVGTYPLTTECAAAADPNYTFSYVKNTLTVLAKAVTVTASNAAATYGASIQPVVGAAYSGLVNGQTPTVLTTQASCSSNFTATTSAGVHTSTTSCTGASSPNYSFSYVNGTLTVGQKVVTVTASDASMTYGDASSSAVTPSYSGFANGDTAAVLTTPPTCSGNGSPTTPAGVQTDTTTCSGAVAGNYLFTYVPGTLTVSPHALTITASGASMTYGDSQTSAVTASYNGFVAGDTAAALIARPTCLGNGTSTTTAGVHPNTTTCSGAVDGNYTISYVSGPLTVSPKALTVTAVAAAVPVNKPIVVTPSYSGFANTDGTAVITTSPTCVSSVSAGAAPGVYPGAATCSGGATTANYVITTYVAATVTITGISPTITSSPSFVTVTAGAPASFSASATGNPAPTPQWQVSNDFGASFTNIPGATGNTYTIAATTGAMDHSIYRAIYSNGTFPDVATDIAELTVYHGPVFTSSATAGFTTGQADTFTVSTAADPIAALTESGTLPTGVKFKDNHDGTATISGTPPASAAKSYALTITAKNVGFTAVKQTLTLVLTPPAVIPPPLTPKTSSGVLLSVPASVHNGQSVHVVAGGYAHFAPITFGWYLKSTGALALSGSWGSADKNGQLNVTQALSLAALTPGQTYILCAIGTGPSGTPRYLKQTVKYTG